MENWDKVITSKRKIIDLRLKQVWDYRDLIWIFVRRDFVVYYKQTIMGPLWYLIQPIFSTITYMLIFGNLAKIGTDGIPQPLFYFLGTMLWTYFSESLIAASNVFINNKTIFGKVYFPRLVVPIASSIGYATKLIIQLFLYICIYAYYLISGADIHLIWTMLLFPVMVFWIGGMATGFGMIVSAITTRYRDLTMVLSFLVSLLMYATPVVYPLSEVPEKMRLLFYINPMTAPIEIARIWIFGAGSIPDGAVAWSLCASAFALFFGLVLFNKNEQTFVDVI